MQYHNMHEFSVLDLLCQMYSQVKVDHFIRIDGRDGVLYRQFNGMNVLCITRLRTTPN